MIFKSSAYASVTQVFEYAWIWLKNALINCSAYGRVLNMPGQSFAEFWMSPLLNAGFKIWQGCEYVSITQGVEYTWMSLNMP